VERRGSLVPRAPLALANAVKAAAEVNAEIRTRWSDGDPSSQGLHSLSPTLLRLRLKGAQRFAQGGVKGISRFQGLHSLSPSLLRLRLKGAQRLAQGGVKGISGFQGLHSLSPTLLRLRLKAAQRLAQGGAKRSPGFLGPYNGSAEGAQRAIKRR
jgi:hypothetical protein